ncbi:UNVERIFIED_CONTAM: hypothetical protein FKN15_052309 [Acipenser sinensis]
MQNYGLFLLLALQRNILAPTDQALGDLKQTPVGLAFVLEEAYSVYDSEIGYCQGQSFLAAVLLLHMPEEQAFCVLVKIMYEYGLKELYRNNFEDLHCKFYQLERLLQMPEEQAFCVLVKIMYEYGLKELYRNNFEDLHCKFYQLERLLQVSGRLL